MRRAAVIGLVTLALIGAGVWVGVRMRRVSAADFADRGCTALEQAWSTTRADARTWHTATTDAHRAARNHRFSAFDAAVMRVSDAVRNQAALPVLLTDTATIGQQCRSQGLDKVPVVTRSPYLTDATTSHVTVNFMTDRPSSGLGIEVGAPAAGCRGATVHAVTQRAVRIATRAAYPFHIDLDGLAPGNHYCYRVTGRAFDPFGPASPPEFVTAPPTGDATPYSFAVIGDFGAGNDGEHQVMRQIATSPASFVVTVGDNAYVGGSQADYGDALGGNVFNPRYWNQFGGRLPAFVAQGNHGYSDFVPYLENWPEAASVAGSGGAYERTQYCCLPKLPQPKHYADAWYAFDWGSTRFYVLEGAWADATGDYDGDFAAHWNGPVPGCAACGTELQWLQRDLAGHTGTAHKFAFFHYPLHVDASDHPPDLLLDGPARLEGLLARNGVDIVFNGHAHIYERNTPQIPGSPMVSYITGAGGRDLAAVQGCSPFDAYAIGINHTSCHAPAPSSDAQVYQYLLVSVAGRQVTVTPVDEAGNQFDVMTYAFDHRAP
jgi:hypothetical protein